MKRVLKTIAVFAGVLLIISCSSKSFKGTWQYNGGVYNGKPRAVSADFKMQRIYTEDKYEAYIIDGGSEPEKYGSGRYEVKNDTFYVTSEYSSQPSQTLGKTIAYRYKLISDSLTINGILPNGMVVEEYWKKIK